MEQLRIIIRELSERQNRVPDLWRMAALMELCPDEVQEQIYLHMEGIGENYEWMRQKIVTMATSKVERGGPVAQYPWTLQKGWITRPRS